MLKILILPCIGIVVLLQFRLREKEDKSINIIERNESLYRDSTGIQKDYINSNQVKTNRYEY